MGKQKKETVMEDAQRAARPSSFKLTPEDLINLVEKYRQRSYNEDVEYLDHELGGVIGLQEKLRTSLDRGLTPIDFQEREEHFGSNFKAPTKRTPFCRLFFGALEDFMLRLLLVCAVISISIDMGFADEHERSHAWIEGFAIFVAVFVVAIVGSWNDYKKEEQFLKLQAISEADNKVVCLRDGREEVVHYNNIVVGDVVKIKAGMNIPVDGIVLKASGVQCNEAAMTGESDDLRKDTLDACKLRQEEKDAENAYHKDPKKNPHDIPSPVILSGTQFATGEGWFLVIVVGKHSCVGKIMAKLEQRVETTPLQEKLEAIGTDIGKIGMYCALLTIHILFLRFFIEKLSSRSFDFFGGENPEHPHGEIMKYCQEWLSYFIIGVTIVVVAVPEGLPLAVMISLAYSVKKMLLDKNFVKRLASCEIMGGANNICSDKTGTLTTNVMTVTNVWAGRELTIQRGEQGEQLSFRDYFNNDRHTSLFTQAMTCNTVGSLEEASATEKAMLKLMGRFGVDLAKKRKEFLPDDYTRFHFTSKRKRMSTILENNGPTEHGYDRRVHLKGAAEIVLACCSHYLNQEGEKVELQDEMKSNLLQIITDYAQQALRTICFAYKDLKQGEGGPTHEDMDEDGYLHVVEKRGFTLISIIGIKDIIRLEVPKAVKTCQKAGITVRMVTGDNKITAMAIAKECNIINEQTGFDNDSVMEGPEFYERMGGLICKTCKGSVPCDCDPKKVDEGVRNLAAFRQIWKSLRVLARSRPEDKYLLVTGLKEMGDIVAVTGDGTNDAPALKKADVGFAMGITGTDVAKHACDIIVMDDNFASIVKACMWGRSIYENIRKFLLFQLQVNIVALVTAFIGSVVLKDSPLEPIQLLWVNLIMDSLGALALATEPPRKELLKRPPYRRDEYIVSRKMVKHLLGNAVYQIVVVYAIVFGGENWFPEPVKEFENPDSPGHVFPGRPYDWDQSPLYALKEPTWGPSRQFTNVFNVFVWMQIFNMLNARKINDEKWIFAGILDNWMYVIIWFIIVGGQVIIVLFGGIAMNCATDPSIAGVHWGIAIAFGLGQLIWDFGLRFIPDSMCPEFGKKQKNPLEDEQHSVFIIRKKRTQSFSLRQPASVNKEGSGRQASLH